jgi:hypothetical protein
MKSLFYSVFVTVLFSSLSAFAQTEGINFQGLARNAAGEVLVSQPISLRLSILMGSESGAVAYSETRQTTTNPQGIFAVVVGDGTAASKTGDFSSIDWGSAAKFIKVEMDPNAGNNFLTMGISRMQAVSVAFYAYGVDASNVKGVLPVRSGGTGVASISELKTSLSLDQVNNTADANKPLSTASQAALATKANASDVTASLATKANASDVTASLATKVDKVTGKELSSNDYTTAEKTKLAAITGTNTGDQDLSAYATTAQVATKANASDVTASLATKVDKVTGKELSTNDYSTAEKNKLAAITGTNTGDQDLSALATITALALKANTADVTASLATKANASDVTTSLATKVDKVTGKELSTNDYTTAEKTKLAAITGTNTGDQDLSALATNTALALKANASDVTASLATKVDKVTGKELSTNDYTTAEKTKLATITGTNTGDQDLSAYATSAQVATKANASDVTASLATKVDKVTGKELSTNDYTTAEKTKLAAITGTNTGDQDLSAYATTAQVATKANSSDVTASLATKANASDVTASLATKVDKVTGKELSTNDYTTAEKTKLAAITGTNTGDQDLSALATNTALALKANTADVTASLATKANASDLSNYVTTNTAQTITEAKTFSKDLAVNGITVGRGGLNVISNTTIGGSALSLNTTGSFNTANGYRTLSANTSGDNNTATGADALKSNTTGVNNTAYGSSTLLSNSTGSGNTAIGYTALFSNLTDGSSKGDNNTAIGNSALRFNTTGSNNTASGTSALLNNSTGSYNAAIGNDAGSYLANGSTDNTTSDYSVYLGSNTKASASNAQNEIVIGYNAIGAGSNTIQLGSSTGSTAITNVKTSGTLTAGAVTYPNTDGSANQVLSTNGSGTLGWTSIASPDLTNYVTTNTAQTITSAKTFSDTTTFSKDLAVNGITVGRGGGSDSTNTAIGYLALTANTTGINNTANGSGALTANTTGDGNTGNGLAALFSNISGNNNTASGGAALYSNTTGDGNTAIGGEALAFNTSGSSNTAIGAGALSSNSTGEFNTAIGYLANVVSDSLTNATAIGNGAIVESSNTIQLGNTDVTNVKTSGTLTAAGMGLGVSAPNASAILEASSTTQGFLPPRLTTTERDSIANPVAGLTIWNSTNTQLEVYDGSYWKNMVGLLVSPLQVGDEYGGGKVFYIFGPSDNGYIKGQTHGLIAATVDQTTDAGVKWFPDKFYGATGTYVGLGLPNTLAIITSAVVTGTTNMSSFAAGLANSYRGGGYIDWFLPSRDELNLLYQVKDAIGGFATNQTPGVSPAYWSSTQKGGISLTNFSSFVEGVTNARVQFFNTGGSPVQQAGTITDTAIGNLRRVRAIRIF